MYDCKIERHETTKWKIQFVFRGLILLWPSSLSASWKILARGILWTATASDWREPMRQSTRHATNPIIKCEKPTIMRQEKSETLSIVRIKEYRMCVCVPYCVCGVYWPPPQTIRYSFAAVNAIGTHKNDGFMRSLVNFPRLQFRKTKHKKWVRLLSKRF